MQTNRLYIHSGDWSKIGQTPNTRISLSVWKRDFLPVILDVPIPPTPLKRGYKHCSLSAGTKNMNECLSYLTQLQLPPHLGVRGDVLLALRRRPRDVRQLRLCGLRLRGAVRLQRRYPLEMVLPRLQPGLQAAAGKIIHSVTNLQKITVRTILKCLPFNNCYQFRWGFDQFGVLDATIISLLIPNISHN